MPSTVVGATAARRRALNCRPWTRSFTHAPFGLDELAGRDRRRVADDGDEGVAAARLDAQHREAVLFVVERDALDRARKVLGVRGRLVEQARLLRVPSGIGPIPAILRLHDATTWEGR